MNVLITLYNHACPSAHHSGAVIDIYTISIRRTSCSRSTKLLQQRFSRVTERRNNRLQKIIFVLPLVLSVDLSLSSISNCRKKRNIVVYTKRPISSGECIFRIHTGQYTHHNQLTSSSWVLGSPSSLVINLRAKRHRVACRDLTCDHEPVRYPGVSKFNDH